MSRVFVGMGSCGLAAGGQAGVERALELFRSEIERDMALMGCTAIADLNRSHLLLPGGGRADR